MAKFCNKCGAPLTPGETHICPMDLGVTPETMGGVPTPPAPPTPPQEGSGGFTPPQGGFTPPHEGSGGFTPPQGGFTPPQTGAAAGFSQPQGGGVPPQDNSGQGGYVPPQAPPQNAQGGYVPPQDNGGQSGFTIPPVIEQVRNPGFWINLLNRMGIGDPESNSDGVYERGMQIAPDNLTLNEGEVPIRQYDVAVLRSRSKFTRSEGRLQVTNKRLLFRATGRSLRGKITLQHEFSLDDIKGFESHNDYRFSPLDLIASIILLGIFGGIFFALISAIMRDSQVLGAVLGLAIGAASLIPFFYLYRRFLLKMICCFAGIGAVAVAFPLARAYAEFTEKFGWKLLSALGWVIAIACVIVTLASIFLFCIKPNLVLDIKTVAGGAPIQIRRRYALGREEYTGFNEVLPGPDADRVAREVSAMINDIQTMGDSAIERWKK